jgi:hypothetical protein
MSHALVLLALLFFNKRVINAATFRQSDSNYYGWREIDPSQVTNQAAPRPPSEAQMNFLKPLAAYSLGNSKDAAFFQQDFRQIPSGMNKTTSLLQHFELKSLF